MFPLETSQYRGLSGDVISSVAVRFYNYLKIAQRERLQISEGWLMSFKHPRKGLSFIRFHGEASSENVDNVDAERFRGIKSHCSHFEQWIHDEQCLQFRRNILLLLQCARKGPRPEKA